MGFGIRSLDPLLFINAVFISRTQIMTKNTIARIFLLALSFFIMQPSMAYLSSPVMVVTDVLNDKPILTASEDDGQTWKVFQPNAAKGKFTSAQCSAATCIAAGQPANVDQPNIPILYFSNDRGTTWSLVNLNNAPKLIIFEKVGCTGDDNETICFAAGRGYQNGGVKTINPIPVLVVTTDNGKSWVIPNITFDGTEGTLKGGSCTGYGASAVCVMVGQYISNNIVKPLILISKNGGKKWSQTLVPDLPDNMSLSKVSCTSSGNNATCAAIGQQWHDHEAHSSVILDSRDSGTTWTLKTVLGEDSPEIKDVSCSGIAPNTACAVAGYRYDTQDRNDKSTSAMIATMENKGGYNWTSILDQDSRFQGMFTGIACDNMGSGATSCIAIGQTANTDITTPNYALFASTDSAKTWSRQILPHLSRWTYRLDMYSLDNISCSNMKTNFNCAVSGTAYFSSYGITNKNPVRAAAFSTEFILSEGAWLMNNSIWGS
jgi:hypothetical protein